MSGVYCLTIVNSSDNENAEFSVSITNGRIFPYFTRQCDNSDCYRELYYSEMIIYNKDCIGWQCYNEDGTSWRGDRTFVDILMKDNDNIVGYAVVEINMQRRNAIYSAKVKKCVEFPKINGKNQIISDEYIKNAIEKAKGN